MSNLETHTSPPPKPWWATVRVFRTEIEATAKRWLADEYDGAQERGVIIGAQDGTRKRRERQRFPPATAAALGPRATTGASPSA